MKYVGLTGGIGSGKSFVAQLFQSLDVPIIDADVIARQVVVPGSEALNKITELFGEEVLLKSGELNRHKVRKLIFNDPLAKEKLESILHPMIQAQIKHQASQVDAPYCIIVIPLLAENHQTYEWLDKVIVVDVSETLQKQRTAERDGLGVDFVEKMMKAQATRDERLRIADIIIDNNQDKENTKQQVNSIHNMLLQDTQS